MSGYLKTSLVEIASAVERMVLPADPNFEKDQVNDAENLIIHERPSRARENRKFTNSQGLVARE